MEIYGTILEKGGRITMISFESDYTTGAHPKILQRLAETNREAMPGYGGDPYCKSAAEKSELPVNVRKRKYFSWQAEHRPMRW